MKFGKSRQKGKAMERSELQAVLEAAIGHVMAELGLPLGAMDPPHTRRTVRALVRLAARVAQSRGCDEQTFLLSARECFASESPCRPRAQA